MATQTILKDDGIFVYTDYTRGQAGQRLREFTDANPSQAIFRESNGEVQAMLVSAAWFDARVAAYEAAIAALPAMRNADVSDDFLGQNIILMIDLIRGRAQVQSRLKKIVAEGTDHTKIAGFCLFDTKAYYADNSNVVLEDGKVGGVIRAYLIHPALYQAMAAAPVAGSYTGTGDGTIAVSLYHSGAVTETFTITATSATSFDIVGSVSGAIGTATVGEKFEAAQGCFEITAGATPFVATDEFTVESVAISL